MPRRKKAPPAEQAPRDHDDFKVAIGMLNSIRVLGPDMLPDEPKTKAERARQFAKIKHVLEDYGLCPETGKIIRVR